MYRYSSLGWWIICNLLLLSSSLLSLSPLLKMNEAHRRAWRSKQSGPFADVDVVTTVVELSNNREEEEEEEDIISSEQAPLHQSSSQTKCVGVEADTKKRKKVVNKPAKKASAIRNYNKLICKEALLPSDDNNGGKSITADATNSTNSSSEQDSASSPSTETTGTQIQQQPTPPPPLKLHSQANHPGLSAYYNWHATITSLYRIYAIPNRDIFTNTFNPAILPMHPSSERGNIAVNITVANQTRYESIQVYWIDYKGNEIYKGNISRGGSWVQTTFIGHPWTFRVGGSDGGEESVLLKYVPFRIAPTVLGAETATSRESSGVVGPVGTQSFTLRDVPEGYVTRNEGYGPACWVDDEILPEPPLIDTYNNGERNLSLFTIHEMQMALEWSCFQMQREDAASSGTGVAASKRLLKYLQNICLQPDTTKYRRLRVGNRIFFESVYSTGARGILLALGFEEFMGFLECGPSEGALNYERLRQISDAMMMVDKTLKLMVENEAVVQPEGSDGYGRAGFGYAGQLNI
mmetsp:Transcript_9170/g.15594  ORF Transcript_9170/g.15594 Transcript_9170/m.15594 type:complete len:521 (-) Transcript_9170:85-1647(-)